MAVLTVRTAQAGALRAGQSVSVQTPATPRSWRFLSPANAPRDDHTLEFHVSCGRPGQRVAGLQHGQSATCSGSGPRSGNGLELDPRSQTDVLMLAGGTGLAPLRALVEELALRRARRRVYLYMGARRADELYDLPTLRAFEDQLRWLKVQPVVSDHEAPETFHGTPADVAVSHRSWSEAEVLVCGSDAMVAGSLDVLSRHGVDPRWVRREAVRL